MRQRLLDVLHQRLHLQHTLQPAWGRQDFFV
jgi:hypothetical protein